MKKAQHTPRNIPPTCINKQVQKGNQKLCSSTEGGTMNGPLVYTKGNEVMKKSSKRGELTLI